MAAGDAKTTGPNSVDFVASALEGVGVGWLTAWQYATYLVAVSGSALLLGLFPQTWPRTVRNVWARQVLFTAVEGVWLAVRIAVAVGLLLVVQVELWLQNVGTESGLVEPFLWSMVIRELGPLLVTLVVIVRSSTAIAAELATMKLEGEVDVLDAQGIDPMTYLVVPRVWGVAVSTFCLGVVFVAATFCGGYLVGSWMGVFSRGPTAFFDDLLIHASWQDLWFFLPKTLLAGAFIGCISSVEGLSVRREKTEVPQAASRAAVRSLTASFLVSAILSLLIYGRILIFEVS